MFGSRSDFVATLLPLARNALADTTINPIGVVAQAALETGWGSRVIHSLDGISTHNLFGIKASRDGSDVSVRLPTLEVRDGVSRRELHSFRHYGSFAEALSDYVNLLTRSPRYERVAAVGADENQFASALQETGYATDPAYAEKVQRLIGVVRELVRDL